MRENGNIYSFNGTTWDLSTSYGAYDGRRALAVFNNSLFAGVSGDNSIVYDGSVWKDGGLFYIYSLTVF